MESGYGPVFGATRDVTNPRAVEISNWGCHLIEVDLSKPDSVEKALLDTKAASIFLVTTTPMPPDSLSFLEAEEKEFRTIRSFFDTLIKVYNSDKVSRHVIFSSLDNVRQISNDLSKEEGHPFIEPLDDGTICAHYTGKARGGQYGLKLVGEWLSCALFVRGCIKYVWFVVDTRPWLTYIIIYVSICALGFLANIFIHTCLTV
jgi:hypothetical protein